MPTFSDPMSCSPRTETNRASATNRTCSSDEPAARPPSVPESTILSSAGRGIGGHDALLKNRSDLGSNSDQELAVGATAARKNEVLADLGLGTGVHLIEHRVDLRQSAVLKRQEASCERNSPAWRETDLSADELEGSCEVEECFRRSARSGAGETEDVCDGLKEPRV